MTPNSILDTLVLTRRHYNYFKMFDPPLGRYLGRIAAGAPVSLAVHPGLGFAGGLGALNGDIRNLVETQGPNIALDELAEAIALGKAPSAAHAWLDQAIDCSCYE